MEIIPGPLDWNSVDEKAWAEFLGTPSGGRVIPKLASLAPTLFAEGEVNKLLIRTGELRGFQLAIQTLLDMAHTHEPVASVTQTSYPSLTDDAAWEDGQKLDKPKE